MEQYTPKKGMVLFFKGSKKAIYKPILLKCLINLTCKKTNINLKHQIYEIAKNFISIIWRFRREFHLSLVSGDGNKKVDSIIQDTMKKEWKKGEYAPLILKKSWDFICYYVIYLLRNDTHFYQFLDKNSNIVPISWDCRNQSEFNKYKNQIEFVQIRKDVGDYWNFNLEIIKRSVDFELVNQLEKLNDSPHISDKIFLRIPRKKLKLDERNLLLAYQQKKCFYCRNPLDLLKLDKIHEDHLIPWSFILETEIENMVLTCEKCNLQKSDNLPSRMYFNKIIKRNKNILFLDEVWNLYKNNRIWRQRGKEELFQYFKDCKLRLINLFDRCKKSYKSDWKVN